jgi:hypothetical protein
VSQTAGYVRAIWIADLHLASESKQLALMKRDNAHITGVR